MHHNGNPRPVSIQEFGFDGFGSYDYGSYEDDYDYGNGGSAGDSPFKYFSPDPVFPESASEESYSAPPIYRDQVEAKQSLRPGPVPSGGGDERPLSSKPALAFKPSDFSVSRGSDWTPGD